MAKYLVVFEEAGGPETYLVNTKEAAVQKVQEIREESMCDDDDMVESVTVYEVTKSYQYQPPTGPAGLREEERY